MRKRSKDDRVNKLPRLVTTETGSQVDPNQRPLSIPTTSSYDRRMLLSAFSLTECSNLLLVDLWERRLAVSFENHDLRGSKEGKSKYLGRGCRKITEHAGMQAHIAPIFISMILLHISINKKDVEMELTKY